MSCVYWHMGEQWSGQKFNKKETTIVRPLSPPWPHALQVSPMQPTWGCPLWIWGRRAKTRELSVWQYIPSNIFTCYCWEIKTWLLQLVMHICIQGRRGGEAGEGEGGGERGRMHGMEDKGMEKGVLMYSFFPLENKEWNNNSWQESIHCKKSFGGFRCIGLMTLLQRSLWLNFCQTDGKI